VIGFEISGCGPVALEQPLARAHPEVAFGVEFEALYIVGLDGGTVSRVVAEHFYLLAVEAVEALPGGNPDVPRAVLQNVGDVVGGEAVGGGKVGENGWLLLRNQGINCKAAKHGHAPFYECVEIGLHKFFEQKK
jgi:hypothetical protein